MFAATAKKAYDLYKDGFVLTDEQIKILAIGNVVAFVVAMLAIKFFIDFLTKYGFRVFGWYRIIVGGAILVLLLMGYKLQVV
jgi:undecaprenyl-diphosphatase